MNLHVHLLVAAAVTTLPAVGGCGYDVVDPIPPPASCPNLVEVLTIDAKWVDDGAGGTLVEVTIAAPADRADVVFHANLDALMGATFVSSQGGATLVARVVPAGITTSFGIQIDCKTSTPTDPTHASVTLTTTSTHVAGTVVDADIVETF